MQKDLYYDYDIAQDVIQETVEFYPGAKKYWEYVSRSLGCDISDLSVLLVHTDFENSDEEGWDIKSHFPAGSNLEVTLITDDFKTDDFYFGQVFSIVYNNEKFIADQNASPFMVWAKFDKENICLKRGGI